jgi:hypothetical protein
MAFNRSRAREIALLGTCGGAAEACYRLSSPATGRELLCPASVQPHSNLDSERTLHDLDAGNLVRLLDDPFREGKANSEIL